MDELNIEWTETPTYLIATIPSDQLWVTNANIYKKKSPGETAVLPIIRDASKPNH